MSEQPPPSPLQLQYATSATDGIPEFHPEAEAMIDAQRQPRELLPLFGKSMVAARYYAESMLKRCSRRRVGSNCEICGQSAGGYLAPAYWEVRIPSSFEEARVNTMPSVAPFVTHHAVCPACHSRWAGIFRTERMRWVRRAALWSLLPLGIGYVVLLVHGDSPDPPPTWLVPPMVVFGAVLGLGLLALMIDMMVPRRLPETIRRRLPHVTFRGVGGLERQDQQGG